MHMQVGPLWKLWPSLLEWLDQRIAKAKSDINFFTSPFSDQPVGKEVHGALYSKASQYDMPVLFLLIGGVVVAVVGVFITYRYRQK